MKKFIFYRDWWDILKDKEDKTRHEIYDALFKKVFEEKDTKVSSSSRMALEFIMSTIGRDTSKYQDICKKNSENAKKRWSRKECDRMRMDATDANNNNKDNNKNNNSNTSNDVVVKEEKEETDNVLLSDNEFIKKIVSDMIGSDLWKESVCMSFNKTKDEIDSSIREFALHVQTMEKVPTDATDAKRWFVSWLRKHQGFINEQKQTQAKANEQEEQRIKESEARHQEYLRNKANATPMPESLKKKLGLN